MASVLTAGARQFSPNLIAFAAANGVLEYLVPMLEITRDIFSTARRVEVYLEEDPEIANERYIVYDVTVAKLSVEQATQGNRLWGRELLRIFPYPRNCLPVLRLDLAE
jgi:hypothetical protein